MTRSWITNSSTTIEAMVNSINAACDQGFIPSDIYMLENPAVSEEVSEALAHAELVIGAYGGEPPDIHLTTLEDEVEFARIRDHHREAIGEATDRGDEVAVDITPGRKFMSAIAFATGMRYAADHVYYFYVSSTDFHGHLYPEIPRTATALYDLTEVAQ